MLATMLSATVIDALIGRDRYMQFNIISIMRTIGV